MSSLRQPSSQNQADIWVGEQIRFDCREIITQTLTHAVTEMHMCLDRQNNWLIEQWENNWHRNPLLYLFLSSHLPPPCLSLSPRFLLMFILGDRDVTSFIVCDTKGSSFTFDTHSQRTVYETYTLVFQQP